MSDTKKRKLRAIIFADIVGYTSLMQQDENNASTLLHRFQNEVELKVEKHNGRIVNFYGDGALCIFNNPQESMHCAMELQEGFQTAPVLPVRIGVHSGTVVEEKEKIYGDAVNIASRIESMGVAGSILLSKKVRNEVKNNPDLQLQSLGSFEFKNVEEAMEVFALANEGFVVPKANDLKGKVSNEGKAESFKPLWVLAPLLLIAVAFGLYQWPFNSSNNAVDLEEKPSIAILPFDNLSNEPEQEYFSDAMADEIRTTLSSIDRLKVISRSSSMYFKEKNVPQKEIAQTLGVNHILSGSVLKFGDQIKVNLEMSNTLTDEIEWTLNTNQRPLNDIFDIQNEIALEVAKHMRVQISTEEEIKTFKKYTNDPELYARFKKLYSNFWQILNADQAENELRKILKIDPDYVPALRLLATTYVYNGLGQMPRDSVRKKALPLFLKAEQLDDTYRAFPSDFGVYKFWYEWDFDAAEEYYLRGLTFYNEDSANNLIELYHKLGNLRGAIRVTESLNDINPIHSFNNVNKIRNLMFRGDLVAAEKEGIIHLERNPNNRGSYFDLARLYLMKERNQEAADLIESGIQNLGAFRPYTAGYLPIAYHKLGRIEDFNKAVKKLEAIYASDNPRSAAYFLGVVYCNIGEYDLGFEWLEKSYKAHDIEMTWLKMDPLLEPVKDDPRYIQMLNRVGFPKTLLN